MYLVGFNKTGYTLFDPQTKKTIDSCNVIIDESKLYKNDHPSKITDTVYFLPEDKDEPVDVVSSLDEINSTNNNFLPENLNEKNDSPVPATLPTLNNDSMSESINIDMLSNDDNYDVQDMDIEFDSNIIVNHCFIDTFSASSSNEVQMSYKEAMSEQNREKWYPAIKKELDMMYKRNVWKLVEKKKGMVIVPFKWVFTVKDDGTAKARIVAVGCRDPEKYDKKDTTSPTPRLLTVRWLIAVIVQNEWFVVQLDVKNAFLYAKLDRIKYMSIPEGTEGDQKTLVCEIIQALYGFPTAPKCWYERFHLFMVSIKFIRIEREPCIYLLKIGIIIVLLIVYVDDILITGNNIASIENTRRLIENEFEIKNLGRPKKFLGLYLEWSNDFKTVFLNQTKYVNEMIKSFGFENCVDQVNIPMIPVVSHKHLSIKTFDIFCQYKRAIGALLYVANTTRPDIAFAVNFLSRAQTNPEPIHWFLLKQVFLYLKGTSSCGLLYKKGSTMLDAYVDADHAGDPRTRRSTSGYMIRYFGSLIGWSARLQQCCAESSGEAEFMGICEAAKDILFIARLTEETVGNVVYPITVYEDSSAAISISNNLTSNSRVKHIELKYLKMKEYVRNGLLKTIKVTSENQLADWLTKALPEKLFVHFKTMILTERE